MKITLLGASGKTGLEVVSAALAKNIEVNAFVRDKSKINIQDSNLHIFTGDALDKNTYGDLLSGAEAVVITLGGIMAKAIKNVAEISKQEGVSKIILMSSYPMSGSVEGMNYLKSAGMDDSKIGEMMPMINDKISQERSVMESGIDWVIIRPTFLTEGPLSSDYQIKSEYVEYSADKNNISRKDVADFIIKALENNEWDKRIVSISS